MAKVDTGKSDSKTDIRLLARQLAADAKDPDDGWYPSLDQYDPGITADDYESAFSNPAIVNPVNLDILYDLYRFNDDATATCGQLAKKFGGTVGTYNLHVKNLGKSLHDHYGIPYWTGPDGREARWPIFFQGKKSGDEEAGTFIWSLREPVWDAIESMEKKGFFRKAVPMKTNIDIALNTILFGPPGTGKTYITAAYAVAICEGLSLQDVMAWDYSEVLAHYSKLKKEGRIAFTTFHQSYGYEEFIEGLRPTLVDNSDVGYEISDGIFKVFCNNATLGDDNDYGINASPVVWKVSLEGTGDNPTRKDCMEHDHIRVGYNDIDPNNPEDKTKQGWTVVNSFANRMQIGDIVFSCYSARTIDAIGVVTGNYEKDETFADFQHVRSVRWLVKGVNEDIVDINSGSTMTLASVYRLRVTKEDALSLIKKLGGKTDLKPRYDKPYVFIIDEINRGNISKIFGELITLIEDSKRAGMKEAASAILPYSKQEFSVPKNVYILGTMNTADRSIAIMDTALRRRFSFVEMMPDSRILTEERAAVVKVGEKTIDVVRMLDTINSRVEYFYDREHMIGHAFFMPLATDPSIKMLSSIFQTKVLPLLQEYFFEDYEKIRLVLGDNGKDMSFQFVQAESKKPSAVFFGHPEMDEETIYRINLNAFELPESYIGIYENVNV